MKIKEIGIDIFLHSQRVGMYTRKLAQLMNYDSKQIDKFVLAAINHDIGKCSIDTRILYKRDSLTRNEYEKIKLHTQYGRDELKKMGYSDEICNAVKMHHENYDGSGYYNLSGEGIPIASRIIRVIDVYDAMTSERCYGKAYTKEEALMIMESEKNKYDPIIFEYFFKMIQEDTTT